MSMDIYTNPGKKVFAVFERGVLQHGHSHEKIEASRYLQPEKRYTIEKIDVWDWSSDVYLKEFPGIRFNSVHFENVN